jgi:hypothetical protein
MPTASCSNANSMLHRALLAVITQPPDASAAYQLLFLLKHGCSSPFKAKHHKQRQPITAALHSHHVAAQLLLTHIAISKPLED